MNHNGFCSVGRDAATGGAGEASPSDASSSATSSGEIFLFWASGLDIRGHCRASPGNYWHGPTEQDRDEIGRAQVVAWRRRRDAILDEAYARRWELINGSSQVPSSDHPREEPYGLLLERLRSQPRRPKYPV